VRVSVLFDVLPEGEEEAAAAAAAEEGEAVGEEEEEEEVLGDAFARLSCHAAAL